MQVEMPASKSNPPFGNVVWIERNVHSSSLYSRIVERLLSRDGGDHRAATGARAA
jgi:hypothetical protein